jgi:hypothetical protein
LLKFAAVFAALFVLPTLVIAQDVIPLSSEPHHHLALHNSYANVYKVEVAPHDSVRLHRHDYDAISIMLGDAEVTVHVPDKPDVHQSLTSAQVRIQRQGYIHSTEIDGDKMYRNVTVELLHPQHNPRNLCAMVVPGLPLNCSDEGASTAQKEHIAPQYETEETNVTLTTLASGQSEKLKNRLAALLVIAVDDLDAGDKKLRSGDFLWISKPEDMRLLENKSSGAARFVTFTFRTP